MSIRSGAGNHIDGIDSRCRAATKGERPKVKINQKTSLSNHDSTEIIFRYLERHGVRDKDAVRALSEEKKKAPSDRTKKGRRVIDLHGLTVDAAIAALRNEIDRCVSRGARELLVIHGYGLHSKPGEGGALKAAVWQYLEAKNDPRVRSFVTAASQDGGEGAVVVRLR
jgi:DNA-nicking Smr family endonuclease